jgi:hypothetical protein
MLCTVALSPFPRRLLQFCRKLLLDLVRLCQAVAAAVVVVVVVVVVVGRQVGANSVPLSPLPQWLQLLPPNHPQYPLGKQLQPCPPALVAVMPRSVESLQRQLRLL